MAIGHQSPGYSLPSFRMKQQNTTTWGSVGNTKTITDQYVFANSFVIARAYGSVPQAGRWVISTSEGSFTITSSDAESSTLTVEYIVL